MAHREVHTAMVQAKINSKYQVLAFVQGYASWSPPPDYRPLPEIVLPLGVLAACSSARHIRVARGLDDKRASELEGMRSFAV
jgi:hypothetical protein